MPVEDLPNARLDADLSAALRTSQSPEWLSPDIRKQAQDIIWRDLTRSGNVFARLRRILLGKDRYFQRSTERRGEIRMGVPQEHPALESVPGERYMRALSGDLAERAAVAQAIELIIANDPALGRKRAAGLLPTTDKTLRIADTALNRRRLDPVDSGVDAASWAAQTRLQFEPDHPDGLRSHYVTKDEAPVIPLPVAKAASHRSSVAISAEVDSRPSSPGGVSPLSSRTSSVRTTRSVQRGR